ncbi:MAG: chromosome segregation protein SMC [Planctomycetaceae bacterium]
MLKALELVGFKSFADRTRFDFPDGITVIVGPNGSGKSNIVDAIKWVLGSQSAKSLRGKDMADVIFKGSQGRGPAGTAEATIIFDNSSGALAVDTPEVRVTRRVFRSGEAEYLINNQPCRLKDVKDLIRGTGIGIDAYSLIEQGKVDRMLQANPKDRRAIFEEAAGISRFKAKKVEAERRLARVQQNLVRLGDIVDEVATRLQSLKSQASKAERYRQANDRLRELRTQLAWHDWTTLSDELTAAESELTVAETTLGELNQRRDDLALGRQQIEARLQEIADKARAAEQQRAEIGRQTATHIGARDADTAIAADLTQAIDKNLRRLRLLQTQSGSAAAELRAAVDRLSQYEADWQIAKQKLNEAEARRATCESSVAEAAAGRDRVQRDHLTTLRAIADLEGNQQRTSQQIDGLRRLIADLAARLEQSRNEAVKFTHDVEVQEKDLARIDAAMESFQKQIELAQAATDEQRRLLTRRRDEVAALKVRLQGVAERIHVLEDLQRRQEGVSGGVRSLLEMLRFRDEGPLSDVVGIVADLLQSEVHAAPLVDAALGDRTQYAVVRGERLQQAILNGDIQLAGRVGLIRLDELPRHRPGDRIRLDGLRGVIGRADRMVQSEKHLQPLVRHLLGTTWLVDSLATALGLRKLSGAGLRFVTSRCELLEQDGSIVIGPSGAAAGLVSRRSELAAAHQERKHYRFQLRETEEETEQMAARLDQDEAELGRAQQQHRTLIVERAGGEANRRHAVERLAAQQQAMAKLEEEFNASDQSLHLAVTALATFDSELQKHRQTAAQLERSAVESDQQLAAARAVLQAATNEVMTVSVDMARAEQKVEAARDTIEQQRRTQAQREAAVEDVRNSRHADLLRRDEARLRILAASAVLTDLLIQDEQIEQGLKELAASSSEIRAQNRASAKAYDQAVRDATEAAQNVHLVSARRDAALMRRTTLAERLLEDYELDLRHEPLPENFEKIENRDEVEESIAHLRAQLQKTGAVNMEALAELEALQARYDELHGQYQDLTAAKDSLQRIIVKINVDSRRLFVDTLEAIRQNFQRLYRKSFGGGTADLILEDSDDPMEAGVEIIATPPGKPSFSNSLLSGGERALTAVALLMSIFQFRPSPFCVLDEVDAPFDEANIGRFVTVLNEFLDHTKFVVVTHSKKTMTAATTLYGVTMQESGISKQVSIRFEDVSDDGEINTTDAA